MADQAVESPTANIAPTKRQLEYRKNRLKYIADALRWVKNNRERHNANCRKWQKKARSKPEVKAKNLKRSKIWASKNPKKVAAHQAKWKKKEYHSNIEFRIEKNCRNRLSGAIRKICGCKKSTNSKALIGCSSKELKSHLENMFLPGMSWENRSLWHIDHIRPCASFDLTKPEQQAACFHYTNLQPLWALDNIKKSDKIA